MNGFCKMVEIERKFLINTDEFKKEAHKKTRITQGFLNTHKRRTVRVRIQGDKGYLTIKGKSSKDGLSRFEWEKEIGKSDAQNLMPLCEKTIIDKIRYEIRVDKHVFEVDEFFGENEGLVIAELELSDENEKFRKPNWLGKEITGKKKYYNSMLSKRPFKTWKKK